MAEKTVYFKMGSLDIFDWHKIISIWVDLHKTGFGNEVEGNSGMTYDLVSRSVSEIFGNARELVLT